MSQQQCIYRLHTFLPHQYFLLSDTPIILVALALASKLATLRPLLGVVSIAGAFFVVYLAWESSSPVRQEADAPAERPRS